MQKPRDESAGSRERVDDVDAFGTKRLPEFLLQNLVHRMDDEVHDFDRRINDAKLVRRTFEGFGKKLLVKLDNKPLLGLRIGDA